MTFVLAVNPVIATIGQIAAIIICLFAFIFILLAVALNLGLALGLGWLREKAELIKLLRPTVNSVNKAAESASRGVAPSANENVVTRVVSTVPLQMHNIDQKVEQGSDRVANAVIEFRARTVQAQTVVKAFLRPNSMKRLPAPASSVADEQGLQFRSPGYRALMEEKVPAAPIHAETGDGYAQTITASQLRDASR